MVVQVVRALYELPQTGGGGRGGARSEPVAIKAMTRSDVAGLGGLRPNDFPS